MDVLDNPIAAFAPGGEWLRGNLHSHSNRSDGVKTPAQVARYYRDAGYDFLAITDHFLEAFDYPITLVGQEESDGLATIPAAELHPRAINGRTWHILAVGLAPDFRPPLHHETASDCFARAAASGAFLVVAHPARGVVTLDELEQIAPAVHAVEVYNGGSDADSDTEWSMDSLAAASDRGLRLFGIASDDAHFQNDTDDCIRGWVWVRSAGRTQNAILEALHAGAFYSSTGPRIHDVRRQGDTLVLECSPASAIFLRGPNYRNERRMGVGLTRAEFPVGHRRGEWGILIVRDAARERAWTNPIWF